MELPRSRMAEGKPLERGGQVSWIETRELIYTNPKGTAMRRAIRPGNYRCSQLVVQQAHATGLRP